VAPLGDARAVADAADALLADEERRTRLAGDGARFVQRFRWETGGAVLEDHLRRYVADPDAFQGAPADEGQPDVPEESAEATWRRYFPA
jgi:hypothetical protein